MKATFKPSDNLSFEVEGESHKDVFTQLAQLDEVFGEPNCGHCKKKDTYFKVRNTTAKKGKNKGKTFTYFEVVCRDCGFFLPVGQHNNGLGTLFPDRKVMNEAGDLVYDNVNRGWRKPSNRTDESEE